MAEQARRARRVADIDFSEIRFRIESIGVAVRLNLIICAGGGLYVASTWSQSNRQTIATMFGFFAVLALLFVLVPHERIVRSRWREAFFFTWSLTSIALAAAVASADGGSTSPLALLFFIPIIFAALSYPMPMVIAIGAADYLAYIAVGVAGHSPNQEYVGFFALCLGCTAALCAWHAHHQDRRRTELMRVSRADPLTGCLNRRGFEERFEAEMSQASRTGRPLGLILVDLDHFKQINDSRGHAAGDEMLRDAVATMLRVARPMDTIGRIGGDEFAVLVPTAAPSDTAKVAERINSALAEVAPATLGTACFPIDAADRQKLLRQADNMLYERKHGRTVEAAAISDEKMSLGWATALAHAVDERITVRHAESRKVTQYCRMMAQGLGWEDERIEMLEIAAILHDVGKVSVPDRVVRKKDPLSPEDWDEIRKHPIAGAEIVARIKGLEEVVPWIRYARENFDGTGYPDRLGGEDIPLAARILHVASAFDAMTTDRAYRRALSVDEALEELHVNAGTQFDPDCVAVFDRHVVPSFDQGRDRRQATHG
jgi:diguanylate cyclase (GGDEF)-like protein